MSQVLPFCYGSALLLLDYSNQAGYFKHQNMYAAALYQVIFWLSMIPHGFLITTCLQKSLIKFSCYKLMFLISLLDIVNLLNCAFMRSIMTFLNVQHCNSGIWVVYYGHFVMFCWWAYCIASVILAVNRLLEFISRAWTASFFQGYRTWIWLIPILFYAAFMEVVSPKRFYFYDPFESKWHFQFLTSHGEESFNYVLIYNNTTKILIIIFSYGTLMLLLKRKLKNTAVGHFDMQTKLTIQATIQASACILGGMTPIVMAYWPIRNFPFNSFISNIMWASQHAASGFVYVIMNRQVKKTIKAFVDKVKSTKTSSRVIVTVVGNERS
ncbi:hypothetical protein L596_008706 [Steinernema carpocapsae]|uniref:G-protein coupled receptors family 1 profile domain-containing protein n=1 Tax=Steinernema carpocapsae TaxID=34508 RepID=A0A4U5PDB4_STECR|nr:hypothetical protein L596_008706 [Steinernema carpocapsae]